MNKLYLAIVAVLGLCGSLWWGQVALAQDRTVAGESAGTVLATSTDALTTAITGGAGYYKYGVTFAVVTTNSVVDLMVNDGVGTRTLKLNGGTTATAGVLYTEEHYFPGDWTINLRVETLTTPVFTIVKEKINR